ncbi:MAG TPA: hypothetical protein VM240_01080 [Verrucomicrobiae bacterium]|nr:hypothetical protein [Verrucomicrobiae bacterium]
MNAPHSTQRGPDDASPADYTDDLRFQGADASAPIESLIGFDTVERPFESWYAYVCRLIRANLFNEAEIRNRLPATWVRWAFSPHQVQVADIALPEPLQEQVPNPDLKFRALAWHPYPEMSSTPSECLRLCPSCIAAGTHSYAMQVDLLERCPVHGEALVHRCPNCGLPLLWQSRSPGQSAFNCPGGCALQAGLSSGLYIPDEEALSAALAEEWAWVSALRERVAITSGPVHIAYPPYLAVATPRVPPLPSPGLLPAMLQALTREGIVVPSPLPHHTQNVGRWIVEVRPWDPAPISVDEDRLDAMRRSFRRGAYQTAVPLVNLQRFRAWLARETSTPDAWKGAQVEETPLGPVFSFPSYLVTNNELTALRRLLARGTDPHTAGSHYEAFLLDLLDNAIARRVALDDLSHPSAETRVAEAFDAIVRTDNGLRRICGRTEGSDESRATWDDLREQAEMAGGMIYITRRYGPH